MATTTGIGLEGIPPAALPREDCAFSSRQVPRLPPVWSLTTSMEFVAAFAGPFISLVKRQQWMINDVQNMYIVLWIDLQL